MICFHCSKVLTRTEETTNITPCGEPVCTDCFVLHYYRCEDCGHVCWKGDVDGDTYCYRCWSRRNYWNPTEVEGVTTIKKTKTQRCFGLELETSRCPNHIKLTGKTCFGAKEDGSISGVEFYSPILRGDRGLAEVRKFCRLAKEFEVDEDCGFHLHIDMRWANTAQQRAIAYAYRLTFELWQQLVREDRWGNTYCGEPEYDPEEIWQSEDFRQFARSCSRYEFVNIRALHDHTTYELRGYQGTLDAKEICNWIKAHLLFVDAVQDLSKEDLDKKFAGSRSRAKRNMRKIFGPVLSRYYSKLWRQHVRRFVTKGAWAN